LTFNLFYSASVPTVNTWQNLAWCPKPLNACHDDPLVDSDNIVIIDLFTQADKINNYKKAGRYIVCYFSAGTYENYRPDVSSFPKSTLYGEMKEWEGETWLDITKWQELQNVMKARMDKGKTLGCDGFEYDNTDFFSNEFNNKYNKESLKKNQIEYLKWLSSYTHDLGLGAFLKNTGALIPDLVDNFEAAINESCHKFNECDSYKPFTDKGKPVLATEYEGDFDKICQAAQNYRLNQLVYDSVNLGHWKKCPTLSKNSNTSGIGGISSGGFIRKFDYLYYFFIIFGFILF